MPRIVFALSVNGTQRPTNLEHLLCYTAFTSKVTFYIRRNAPGFWNDTRVNIRLCLVFGGYILFAIEHYYIRLGKYIILTSAIKLER